MTTMSLIVAGSTPSVRSPGTMTLSASASEVSASINTMPSSVSTTVAETRPALSTARSPKSLTGAGADGRGEVAPG
ncbi:hypothetical protein [Kitasatospora griseola]|uniref:hypothetical protein n=1 Tax=Kitasatospora griseola TaxID=2064 RepID=UPI00382920D8